MMNQSQQSTRPRLYLLLQPTTCSKRKFGISPSSNDAWILHDNMPASALEKVVTFEGEVVFERKHPTSIKREATSGERIDLSTSGQLEVLETPNEGEEQHLLLSSLSKQVLNSPGKSTFFFYQFDQEPRTGQDRQSRTPPCVTPRSRYSRRTKLQLGTTKFYRSKIVFSVKNA